MQQLKGKNAKRILCLILALAMLLTAFPVSAFAETEAMPIETIVDIAEMPSEAIEEAPEAPAESEPEPAQLDLAEGDEAYFDIEPSNDGLTMREIIERDFPTFTIYEVTHGGTSGAGSLTSAIGANNRAVLLMNDIEITGAARLITANRTIRIFSNRTDGGVFNITRTDGDARHFIVGATGGANVSSHLHLHNVALTRPAQANGMPPTTVGGGVSVVETSHLHMHAGSIISNNRQASGGGVNVAGTAHMTMHGGRISGNTATGSADGNGTLVGGGGIRAQSGAGWLRIHGGTIGGVPANFPANYPDDGLWTGDNPYANVMSGARGMGGGVYVGNRNFEFTGGYIIGNRVTSAATFGLGTTGWPVALRGGGGLAVFGDLTAGRSRSMSGGTIAYNQTHHTAGPSTGAGGGGMFLAATRTTTFAFTMTGDAEVRNNFAASAVGGIQSLTYQATGTSGNRTLTMSGNARVANNRSGAGGGGVGMSTEGRLVMEGNATIEGNHGTSFGGVQVWRHAGGNNSQLTMRDNAAIINNHAGGNGGGVSVVFSATTSDIWGSSQITLSGNSRIEGNTAGGDGGGIFYERNMDAANRLDLQGNARIANNTANNGGGIWVALGTTGATGNLPSAAATTRIRIASGVTFEGNHARHGARVDENLAHHNRANIPHTGSLEWLGVNPLAPATVEWRNHIFNNADINTRNWTYLRPVEYRVEGTAYENSTITARVTSVTGPATAANVGGAQHALGVPRVIDLGTLVHVGSMIEYEVTGHPTNADLINWTATPAIAGNAMIVGPRALPSASPNLAPDVVIANINYRYYPVTFALAGGSYAAGVPATRPTGTEPVVHSVRFETLVGGDRVPSPQRTHYNFAGWRHAGMDASEPNLQNATVAVHEMSGAITFTAQWTRITHPVTFVLGGGTYASSTDDVIRTVDQGTAIGLANVPEPSRTDYTFDNWDQTSPAGGTNIQRPAVGMIQVTDVGALTFTARWLPIMRTVTFDLDGGSIDSNAADITRQVQQNRTLNGVSPNEAMPSGMYRTGYSFQRWEVVSGGTAGVTFSGTTTVPNDMRVIAIWQVLEQGVTFQLNGGRVGTNYGPIVEPVDFGSQITAGRVPDAVRQGWRFDGWIQTTPAGNNNLQSSDAVGGIIVSVPMEFEAQWTRISYTVSFHLDNGTYGVNTGPITRDVYRYVTIGESNVPYPPTLAREHYNFLGWNYDGAPYMDRVAVGAYEVTGNASFTARWERRTHAVTFNLNGGTYSGSTDHVIRTLNQSSPISVVNVPVPTREHYTFAGWNQTVPAGGVNLEHADVGGISVAGAMTFVAQWTRDTQGVTFVLAGGTYDGSTDNVVRNLDIGAPIGVANVPVPERENYTFASWNQTAPIGGTSLSHEEVGDLTVIAGMIFTAQWTRNIVNVTFIGNGGTPAAQTASAAVGGPYSAAMSAVTQPTRSGWVFQGWFTSQYGGVRVLPSTTVTRTDAHNLYAQWERSAGDDDPVVRFWRNHSTPDVVHHLVTVRSGDTVVPPISPTRAGYVFDGWTTTAAGGTAFNFTNGITAATNVYAQWTAAPGTPENEYVTVDFFWNTTATDTALYRGVRIARETRVGLFANPQRTNYTFIGWSTVRDDLALANEFNFDAPVTAEVTNVYAQWLADTVFTLTYVAGTNGIGEPHVVTDVRVDSNRVLLALNVTGITPQEGYRFIGWIIEGETELRQPGTIILVDGDLTIVAQWEPIPPDGRIEKRAGSRVALIGTTIGYTITITNHDTIPMTNYEVIDELDTRLVEFVEGSLRINGEESYNATHTDGVIHVTLNEIAPGETLAITFRVTVLDAAVGMTIYNTAILRHQIHGTMDASETVEVSILSIRPNPVHYAYLIGFPDGTVGPRANITRAEVATIFFRLICDEYRIEIWSQENPFSDVALERWYNNSISTMANDGFLLGIPDGTFQPSRAITRGEFATIVSRFMNVTYTGAYRFPDIDGHWAADAINAVAYVGWVLGYPDGTFRPNAPITRSEVTAIVNRIFIRNLAEVDYLLYGLISWPDNANPNSWYYLHMKEAANSNHHDMLECGFYKMWTELIPPRDWAVLHHPNSRPEDILQ